MNYMSSADIKAYNFSLGVTSLKSMIFSQTSRAKRSGSIAIMVRRSLVAVIGILLPGETAIAVFDSGLDQPTQTIPSFEAPTMRLTPPPKSAIPLATEP